MFRLCKVAQVRHNGYSGFCGDGQHDPSNIPDFVHAMTTNGADVVIGSRFLEKNKQDKAKNGNGTKNGKGIPRYRIAGMKVLNLSTRVAGNRENKDI